MKKRSRPATKKERARLLSFVKAAKAGQVVVGNSAAQADKGKGSVKCWATNKAFGVEYSIPGFGFGGFDFTVVEPVSNKADPENIVPTGRLHVDSEMMGREFVKKVMCQLIDEAEWDHDEVETMRGPYSNVVIPLGLTTTDVCWLRAMCGGKKMPLLCYKIGEHRADVCKACADHQFDTGKWKLA